MKKVMKVTLKTMLISFAVIVFTTSLIGTSNWFVVKASEENEVVVNSCSIDLTRNMIKEHFGTNAVIGAWNYCFEKSVATQAGDIFIFEYGNGKKGTVSDIELCYGISCPLGDATSQLYLKYQPRFLLDKTF